MSIFSFHTHFSSLHNVYRAGALFNAVKKQFGLHSYLLSLNLPKPPPKPIPVPALMPRLPSPPLPDSPPQNPMTPVTATIPTTPAQPTTLNTLSMEEKDIQQTARFTREFLVMSLVPWMEKCVVDWNENVRLPHHIYFGSKLLYCMSLVFFDSKASFTVVLFDSSFIRFSVSVSCPCASFIFRRFSSWSVIGLIND